MGLGAQIISFSEPIAMLEKSGHNGEGNSMESGQTLAMQLQELVDCYFEKYPHMSVNALAMKSGVAATTLRRIKSGSIKSEPAPHTVLNIASAVTNEKRLAKLVAMFEGEMGEVLKQTFGPYIAKEMDHEYDSDLNIELQCPIKYFIYKLASNRKGVTWNWVADNFGKLGMDRLEEMKLRGLLEGDDQCLHAIKKNFSLDIEVASKHLPELVKFYKPKELSEGKNLFYTLSESLNEKGIQRIKAAQKEAVQIIYEVMTDKAFAGDIPYFTLTLSDTMQMSETEVLQ